MWKDCAFGKALSVWYLLLYFCWTCNTPQIWNTKKYKKKKRMLFAWSHISLKIYQLLLAHCSSAMLSCMRLTPKCARNALPVCNHGIMKVILKAANQCLVDFFFCSTAQARVHFKSLLDQFLSASIEELLVPRQKGVPK